MNETVIIERPGKNQLHVTRVFNAPKDLVWKAWTEPAILDEWWGPKPWKAETKYMDFREGGRWLYSMNGPEGEVHWSLADFTRIIPGELYEGVDAFCDEEGNPNLEMGSSRWQVRFSSTETGTLVEVTITFPDEEVLKMFVEMGFKEGFTAAHGNLDEWLAEHQA